MRLWSFHPALLDNVGLARCFNEGYQGIRALKGEIKMWRNHPQLDRFKSYIHCDRLLHSYLHYVKREAMERGRHYKAMEKIKIPLPFAITVTVGQLEYEWKHYLKKLQKRNIKRYKELYHIRIPDPNPIFYVVPGPIEYWEKVKEVKP